MTAADIPEDMFASYVEEIISEAGKLVLCTRCGGLCQIAEKRNKTARLLRLSKVASGLCVNCAITHWLKRTELLPAQLMTRNAIGSPLVQRQVGRVLQAGGSDATLSEITWEAVARNWDLPLPGDDGYPPPTGKAQS